MSHLEAQVQINADIQQARAECRRVALRLLRIAHGWRRFLLPVYWKWRLS